MRCLSLVNFYVSWREERREKRDRKRRGKKKEEKREEKREEKSELETSLGVPVFRVLVCSDKNRGVVLRKKRERSGEVLWCSIILYFFVLCCTNM